MFRSLFIGLLIFSALASKGADVQIKQNISNITPEMLLELYNAFVFNTDQQADNAGDGSDEAFFWHAYIEKATKPAGQHTFAEQSRKPARQYVSAEKKGRPAGQYVPVIWTEAVNCGAAFDIQCARISVRIKPLRKNEVYRCGTDLSPPDYR